MIEKIITELGPWIWWVLGFFFLILEIFVPGVFFLWIGLAAIIIGMNAIFLPMSWTVQIALFAILALVLVVIGKRIYKRFDGKGKTSLINQGARKYVGKTFPLIADMQGGRGHVRIGDSQWMVEGDSDLSSGTLVRVVSVRGTILVVEPV